jgi:plasmid stabilization system protein ParE
MTPVTLLLDDDIRGFAERQASALGLAGVGDYLGSLVRQARETAAAARLNELLREGMMDSRVAQTDVARHLERYASQPAIAVRFEAALRTAMEADGGDALPNGVIVRPLRGFADFAVYCAQRAEGVTVVRVLHKGRDLTV